MSLNGQLSTMALGDLLQWIYLGRKDGTLQIDVIDCRKLIYILQGRVFFASSTKEYERLGQFLVRHEHITPTELEECLRLWKEEGGGVKLSEIIVGRGLMTDEHMVESVGDLVQEIIYDLFLYEDGYFDFLEGQLPPQVQQSFHLDSQWLMFEGLRRLDEYRRNAKELPPSDQVLVRTGVGEDKLRGLDKNAEVLYGLIDGEKDVETLLHSGPLSVYQAQLQLMTLLANELVSLKALEPRELQARRVRRVLDRGTAYLNQGDLLRARDVLKELSEFVEYNPDLHGFALRLTQKLYAEVEAKTGGLDYPIMVDPEVLRGRRYEVLTADQGFVLSRIGERATLREVLFTSGFPKYQTYSLLFTLFHQGLILRVDTGKEMERFRGERKQGG
jgi:uncharacterized protein DUF4388